jgi:CheY-like chemotaxis protein
MIDRDPGPPPQDPPVQVASVVRLRPIRTLTIARDLAFRQRAMTVLAELGPTAFAVTPLERPDEVVALVAEQQPDVVVLDVTVSGSSLAHVVAALADSAPRVGIVAVSDCIGSGAHALPVMAKWGWAAELLRGVQDAYRRGNPLKEDISHAGHNRP